MTTLYDAVVARNLQKVNELIASGADVNMPDTDSGEMPLTYALLHNYPNSNAISLALIDASGFNPDYTDNAGTTYLMLAAGFDRIDIAKALINHNADINAKDMAGNTALMYAIGSNLPNMVELLINHDADVNVINADGKSTLTMLLEMAPPPTALINSIIPRLTSVSTDDIDLARNEGLDNIAAELEEKHTALSQSPPTLGGKKRYKRRKTVKRHRRRTALRRKSHRRLRK